MIILVKNAVNYDCPRTGQCAGSRCMAWRWAQNQQRQRVVKQEGTQCRDSVEPVQVNDRGYCGLAGIPVFQ